MSDESSLTLSEETSYMKWLSSGNTSKPISAVSDILSINYYHHDWY
jgi:hypothetical protein